MKEYQPQIGDMVFYDWGHKGHNLKDEQVGIIVAEKDNWFKVEWMSGRTSGESLATIRPLREDFLKQREKLKI